MNKLEAIEILEDIEYSLNNNDIEKVKKDITTYQKNIEISINTKIQKLIVQYTKYREIYGENGRRTINLSKKIDRQINKINRKYSN